MSSFSSSSNWTPSYFSSLLAEACQETELSHPSDIIIASVHVAFFLADFEFVNKNGVLSTSSSIRLPKSWNNSSAEYVSFVYKRSDRLYQIKFLTLGNHVLVHGMESNNKEKVFSIDFETFKLADSDLVYPILSPASTVLTKNTNNVEAFLQKCKSFISGFCVSEDSCAESKLAAKTYSSSTYPDGQNSSTFSVSPSMTTANLSDGSSAANKDITPSQKYSTYVANSTGNSYLSMPTSNMDMLDDDADTTMMIPRHPLFHKESRVPPVCTNRK